MKNKLNLLFLLPALSLLACAPSTSSEINKEDTFENYFKASRNEYTTTFSEVRTKGRWHCEANSMGDVKALVVPIEFTDQLADNLPAGRQGTLDDIELAFFGGDKYDNPELNWESVSSFYEKSSMGNCHITGTVLPWHNLNMTSKEFAKNVGPDQLVADMYEYFTFDEGANEIDLHDYDANDDGYVDLLYLIYTHPTIKNSEHDNSNNAFWAFTSQKANAAKPNREENEVFFSRFVWASYDFLYQDVNYDPIGGCHPFTDQDIKNNVDGVVDAHTYIHETGHGLGLYDYYSYDYNGDEPMGKLDMMDNNIGDHNSYSKAILGWVEPYVVEGKARIEIKPFNNSGDCILVPIRERDWKNSIYNLMDEYLMIEYDTPEGLAFDDADLAFGGEYKPKYYNRPGVRVMHADSRIGRWFEDDNGGLSFHGYVDHPNDVKEKGFFPDLAHENTKSRTLGNNRLLELVTRTGRRHLKGESGNAMLWGQGTKIDGFKMNSINPLTEAEYDLGFSIEVVSMDREKAVLEFIPNGK